jgi:hypothetical protein
MSMMWVYRTLLPLLATVTAIAGVVAWTYSTLHPAAPPPPDRIQVVVPPHQTTKPPRPPTKRVVVTVTEPKVDPESVGVKECDDFLNRYLACIRAKMPEKQAAQVSKAMEQARESWRKAASTPSGREALAKACLQAQEAAKKAVTSLGCRW